MASCRHNFLGESSCEHCGMTESEMLRLAGQANERLREHAYAAQARADSDRAAFWRAQNLITKVYNLLKANRVNAAMTEMELFRWDGGSDG